MRRFVAHVDKQNRQEALKVHLREAAILCSRYCDDFGAREQGYLAGLMHDIGKYSEAFQTRLLGNGKRVDHSTYGAALCAEQQQPFAAFAIAGHHSGLPDGGSRADASTEPTFFGRLKRARSGAIPNADHWQEEIEWPCVRSPRIDDPKSAAFFTRMLFSALIDADYRTTRAFMSGIPVPEEADVIDTLATKCLNHAKSRRHDDTPLNQLRHELLEHCLKGAEQPRGLFTLSAPTGSGKTLSSLAFALTHAQKYGLKRIVYVAPFCSIIEQTAESFRRILGAEAVLEHHSAAPYDETTADVSLLSETVETWSKPVIVTTAVEFFESLFASRPSKCRKLHNLAKSVIVLDEVQTLPVAYLRPSVHALSELTARYGVTLLLCSATQPALLPLFRDFLPDLQATELCPDNIFDNPYFHRVTFRQSVSFTLDTLADDLGKRHQVLCIVNTRRNARRLFEKIAGESAFHLSTLMTPIHRSATLETIRSRLRRGLPCRVVSTSLVEAGVDLDFPSVYREEAGLDSMLQAAGRCNREGRLAARQSIVTLFHFEESDLPASRRQERYAARYVMGLFENIGSRQAVDAYFHELFTLFGRHALDTKEILKTLDTFCLPFRRVSNAFHLIETNTRTVYAAMPETAALLEQLHRGERSLRLFRALDRYSLQVYPNQIEWLTKKGALTELDDKAILLLTDLSFYHPKTGLVLP